MTNTSFFPFLSAGTRLLAAETKAIKLPFVEMLGDSLSPLPWIPALLTETRLHGLAIDLAYKDVGHAIAVFAHQITGIGLEGDMTAISRNAGIIAMPIASTPAALTESLWVVFVERVRRKIS